jgi:hypothetical protein
VIHSLVASLLFGFVVGVGFHIEIAALLWSAFGTALAAPFVFSVLRRLDAGFMKVAESPSPGGIR